MLTYEEAKVTILAHARAQELEKVAPELVNNDNEYKGVAYGNLTGYLIEAIKELEARVKELENK